MSVVRLKRWTDYAIDGRSRVQYQAPKGEVAVFLRIGNEPEIVTAIEQLVPAEQAIAAANWYAEAFN